MKFLPAILIITLLAMSNCSTSHRTGDNASQEVIGAEKIYANLADYISTNSNVIVRGSHPDVRLEIRGGSGSLTSDTRPFIYVNRTPIGRNYINASNAVDPNNIERVEVLSSLAQLTRYGQEGHSGVIIVHTRNNVTD